MRAPALSNDRIVFAGIVAASLLLHSLSVSAAEPVEDFYRGKQVKLIVGQDAGSPFDLIGRLVTRHMSKYIPGHPTFLVQLMPAAGGRVAANWLYNLAPRDGSAIATFTNSAPMDQARAQDGVQYDATKFHWIGTPISDNSITVAWSASGVSVLDDVNKKGGLICGGLAASTPSTTLPVILKNLTGADIKLIPGYPGQGAISLALQRGELNCMTGTMSTLKFRDAALLEGKKLSFLAQWGA